MIDIQATTKSKYYDHNSIIISWIQKISLSVDNYVPQTKFVRHIVFALFLIIIIIILINMRQATCLKDEVLKFQ